MNELQVFTNEQFGEVRVFAKDNENWFVAKDVCNILDLSNPTVAIQNLDTDEVTKLNLGGKIGETNLINESGLYTLIIRSRKDEAKKFRKWVTGEVLPSIRKHGLYAQDELLDNPDLLIAAATKLKEERQARLEAEKQRDRLIHQNKLYTTSEIPLSVIITGICTNSYFVFSFTYISIPDTSSLVSMSPLQKTGILTVSISFL